MPELTCPVCGGALHREERSLRCGAGHCYDIARQGYVNLLRTNRSKDKRHGDDKRMVAARTAFLDAGYYAPLRDAIAAAATEYTSGDADVLDAGCGEGYYTAHVLHTLQAQGASPSVCGVDISRDALICAHRRAPNTSNYAQLKKQRKAAVSSGAAAFARTGACFVQNPSKRACGPL